MPTTKDRTQSTTQKSDQPEMTLSEAASIMRDDNASPEDRSRAASVMGREGGKHSHDRDARNRNNIDQNVSEQAQRGTTRQKETTDAS